MLMYDTPDEAAVKEVLRKTYGEGKLEKTGERRYTYITDSKTYFVSQF